MLARISVKVGRKGKAQPHAKYILGIGEYKKKNDEVVFSHSENLPSDCSPLEFWQTADEKERANGSTYREHIISLPREFSLNEQISFIQSWCNQEISKHPYTFAIHHVKDKNGELQPHCHLMFSDRRNDGIERTADQFFKRYNAKDPQKGGAKKFNTGMTPSEQRTRLKQLRERYGEHLKAHLRQKGMYNAADSVDMRNWRERGLSEPPTNITLAQINLQKRIDEQIEKHPFYLEMKMDFPKPGTKKKIVKEVKDKETEIIIQVTTAHADNRAYCWLGWYDDELFRSDIRFPKLQKCEIKFDYAQMKITDHNLQYSTQKTNELIKQAEQEVQKYILSNRDQYWDQFKRINNFNLSQSAETYDALNRATRHWARQGYFNQETTRTRDDSFDFSR